MSTDPKLLSETARVHVEGVEALIGENAKLKQEIAELQTSLAHQTAMLTFCREALDLTRRQLNFYQNYAVSMTAQINVVQTVFSDLVAKAREAGGPETVHPLSAEDEAKLASIISNLAPETGGFGHPVEGPPGV